MAGGEAQRVAMSRKPFEQPGDRVARDAAARRPDPALTAASGKVCTRRMILENVWGPGYRDEVNYLKVYAYRIRRKLGDERGMILQSDPSAGYRLAPPAEGRP
jgi:two-component system KDP operon response regulator KdpE